ncbi:alkaline phosphatase D family protein [Acetobacteraceae bacterium H6797]|nr:alkaline phosphatase D family protein [Acetobacteraceae bacterium H6797]
MPGSAARHIIDLSRRGLLRGGLAAAALAALATPTRRLWAAPRFASDPFSLGVASGDPLPDGVVIWTRLAPEPLTGGGMPHVAVEVNWEIAADETFQRIAGKGTALARPELGHAVHVEVSGLAPATPYFYRFTVGDAVSRVGRTRTAPPLDAMPGRMRFISAGCQNYEHGYFTAWRHIAEEAEIDCVFHYGDYIYEGGEQSGHPRRHQGGETYSLDDYRNRYALYKLDPDLAAAHAAHPFLTSFDDHEVDNNWTGSVSEEDGTTRSHIVVPPEIFALRKQAAFQAWYENSPVRRALLPRGPEITAWRALRYGRLVDVAVLDTRSYRDDQPCGDGTKAPCAAVSNPQAQVLGPRQEAWLKERLTASPATWKVLAQQVPMMRRDYGHGSEEAFAMDKWDGYPAARQRLFDHIDAHGVKNVCVLTGDVHSAWAGTLRKDFRDPRSAAVGIEFIASSITSNGDGSETLGSTARLMAHNPHIAFFNNRRGYTLHEATAGRMETIYRAVDYVSRPGAGREDKGRFIVETGTNLLEKA